MATAELNGAVQFKTRQCPKCKTSLQVRKDVTKFRCENCGAFVRRKNASASRLPTAAIVAPAPVQQLPKAVPLKSKKSIDDKRKLLLIAGACLGFVLLATIIGAAIVMSLNGFSGPRNSGGISLFGNGLAKDEVSAQKVAELVELTRPIKGKLVTNEIMEVRKEFCALEGKRVIGMPFKVVDVYFRKVEVQPIPKKARASFFEALSEQPIVKNSIISFENTSMYIEAGKGLTDEQFMKIKSQNGGDLIVNAKIRWAYYDRQNYPTLVLETPEIIVR